MKQLPSKSTRTSRMLKWLQQQQSPIAIDLRLELDGEGDAVETVACWSRNSETYDPASIAAEIDEILCAISSEQDAKITGRLAWLTATGVRWTTFPIKVEPESGSQAFDGSSRNLLVQQQRHIESMALTYFKATDAVLKTYSSTLDSITRLLETRENRSSDLELEIARLRDENAALTSQANQTSDLAENALKQAEDAASKLESQKGSSGDGQILTLLSKVAGDMMAKAP